MSSPQVFISYSRADKDVAKRLATQLEREHLRVWTDRELEAGDDWVQGIEQALSASNAIVLLLSPRYMDSSAASFERALALRTALDTSKVVLPVLVKPVDPDSLPSSLRRIQWIDATRSVETAAQEIRRAVVAGAA